jgi:hypothetical protein
MKLIHNGTTYECEVAVKCINDCYIKLYDANGTEIVAFHNISDFSDFSVLDGSFTDPCNCMMPIPLTAYSIGGRTISTDNWTFSDELQKYYFEIENNLISDNITTCNILLLFAENTELSYSASQEKGKIVLYVDSVPEKDIVIDSIQLTRV